MVLSRSSAISRQCWSAAPRLRLLAADVGCTEAAEAHRLLRNEDSFAALRVRKLGVSACGEVDALAVAAVLPAHTCLKDVRMYHAQLSTVAVMDAVVDAALVLRLASLTLYACHLTPASALALARLISGGAVAELYVLNNNTVSSCWMSLQRRASPTRCVQTARSPRSSW
jgi:hypothetical protein